MKSENDQLGTGTRRHAAPALLMAMALTVFTAPPSAGAETVLTDGDAVRVFDAAVSLRVMPGVWKASVETACYFDPKVKNSMRCSWSTFKGAADPFRVKQKIERQAKRACKKAGGKKCELFWRNGVIRYEGLSPKIAKRLGAVLKKIPSYGAKAKTLPEGVGVSKNLR